MRQTSVIVNRTRDSVVCEQTELANNPWLRLRGLLGRDDLPVGRGMLLRPSPSIHSAFMRFEFDAIFLDRDMKVVGIAENVPPWRTRRAKGAKSVLELAAGEAAARGVQLGDELAVSEGGGADPSEPVTPT
jgi:uncharacterized protein